MTTDRAAFLAAIRENPDDDLPRLIYADWLDEHGEPERAEFIRLDVELTRLFDLVRLPDEDPQIQELRARATALCDAHGTAWRAQLPQIPGTHWGSFHRGFIVDAMIHDFDAFTAAAERAFSLTLLYHLSIYSTTARSIRRLAACPWLANLRYLTVANTRAGNAPVLALARSLNLGRLRHLILHNVRIGDVAAQALAESPGLADLKWLGLMHNAIGDTGAEALAAAPHWQALHGLDLSRNPIGPEGRAILRARYGNAVKL